MQVRTGLLSGVILLFALVVLSANVSAKEEKRMDNTRMRAESGVNVNDHAPDFTLSHSDGEFTLSESMGNGTTILYFYPADDTPICTKQAQAFRDRLAEFAEHGATIYGISPDSLDSHADFSEKHGLPYILLADQGNKVRRLYGMPKGYDGWETRATYVIDSEGVVRHIIVDAEDIDKHINESLHWARRLHGESRRVAQN